MRRGASSILLALLAAGCGENRTLVDGLDGGGQEAISCLPNLDGQIDSEELAPQTDREAEYLFGADRSVDLGDPPWDWSEDAGGEEKRALVARRLAGQWYAPRFPGGEFVVPLSADGALEAVYARDQDALWLLGLASAAEGESETVLPYEAPVPVFRFPLRVGDRWTATGEVLGGTLGGLPYSGTDTYEVAVEAAGELALPHLSFTEAMRVNTRLTIEPAAGGEVVTRQQASFLFECFGEVARAVSRDGETAEDFSIAAEVRRFSL